jgi:hypothetical protein
MGLLFRRVRQRRVKRANALSLATTIPGESNSDPVRLREIGFKDFERILRYTHKADGQF